MAVAAATFAPKPWPPIVAIVILFSFMNRTISSDMSFKNTKLDPNKTYLHSIGCMMIGITLIPVIKKPDISVVENFIVTASKERLEVG